MMGSGAAYRQHAGKVVEDGRFSHMMALALDPNSGYKRGLIRCITSRKGNVKVKGYVDRSQLYLVSGDTFEHFTVGEKLEIKNENEIVGQLGGNDWDCIGLEDPDIFYDQTTDLKHLYFTIPLRHRSEKIVRIYLGHAVGHNLVSLEMTAPVLRDELEIKNTAKEVSIAPINSRGFRYNLFEGSTVENDVWYSTVRVAIAEDVGKPWQFGKTLFHPKEHQIPWIGGHASPGPLFPRSFIDVGQNRLLGIINGREVNRNVEEKTLYGMFSVGLFIYNYEIGKIDWVSAQPLIQDSEAKTITFASQFVETTPGEGILYAHVDDSFVRAYTLLAEGIKSLLP